MKKGKKQITKSIMSISHWNVAMNFLTSVKYRSDMIIIFYNSRSVLSIPPRARLTNYDLFLHFAFPPPSLFIIRIHDNNVPINDS